ncbi:hypothetical protein C2E23DRAFT_845727 [Lenzites betulinus]|nr:hypothetical protein C2E23DRAFT_845727 [Lenzites betulinus]
MESGTHFYSLRPASPMSSHPVLPEDVLLEIMAASSPPVCARFMRTSHFYHDRELGPRVLLSHPSLRKEDSLLSFLDFIHAQPDIRFSFITSLDLSFQLSHDASLRLSNAVPHMHKLRHLTIHAGESVLVHHKLGSAIASLTSLRELCISDADDTSLDLLRSLRVQLTRVHLDFDRGRSLTCFDEYMSMDEWDQYHPALLLEHSASTLEHLSANRWSTSPDDPLEMSPVYYKMRVLETMNTTLPFTQPWIRAYPNLERLAFTTYPGSRQMGENNDPESWRAMNLSDQLEECTWRRLREFEGTVFDLYLLGLAGEVDHVVLREVWTAHLHMLGPALVHVRPRILELDGWPGDLRQSPPDGRFSVFQEEGMARLEELTIDGRLSVTEHTHVDVGSVMEDLLSALASCQALRTLTITVWTEWLQDGQAWGERKVQPEDWLPLLQTEGTLERFDPAEGLMRLQQAVPTLARATVTLKGVRRRPSRTVVLEGGSVRVQVSPGSLA